jgi:hypothetical protein
MTRVDWQVNGRPQAPILFWISLFGLVSAWSLYLICLWLPFTKVSLPIFFGLSWDEYQYLPYIAALQDDIRRGDFGSFVSFQDTTFGYGAFFWQLYAIATMPFNKWLVSGNGNFLFVLRLLTLFIQCATALFAFAILRRIASRTTSYLVLAAVLVAMPGLLLTYKPFSPDYLATLLALLSTYAGIRALGRDVILENWLILSSLTFGASVAAKLYNVMLALPLLMLFGAWLSYSHHSIRSQIDKLWLAVVGAICGFALCNIGTVIDPKTFYRTLRRLSRLMNSPTYMNAIQPPGLITRVSHWFQNPVGTPYGLNTFGIRSEFFGILMLLTMAVTGVLAAQRVRAFKDLLGPVLLFSGAAILMMSVVMTNRVWSWYLLTPVFLVAIGFAACASFLIADRKAVALALAAVIIWHILSGVQGLQAKAEGAQTGLGDAARLTALYKACSEPVLARRNLRGDAVILSFGIPYSAIFAERVCWSASPASCIDDKVKLLLTRDRDLSAGDREKILGYGFSPDRCSAGYTRYERF